jgi:predicted acetylornithine/succinylornithine family transaminase
MDYIQEKEKLFHFDLYRRLPVSLVRGKGARVWDSQNKEYIDFLAGIGVNALGHSHPAMIEALHTQADKLIHISNIYYNEPQARLAESLSDISGYERSFFCNSGLEANEAAIKLARKYGYNQKKKGAIISFSNSFHGRSIASISLGGKKLQKGFGPLPDGFLQLPYNDIDSIEKNINEDTIAVFIEAIQGEGGIIPGSKKFMSRLEELCRKNQALLVFDEIQTGFGRTGKLFGYQHFSVSPDIITLGKALGGGFPIGAVLTSEKISRNFEYGDHGTTFGGNPLACAVANAVIATLFKENLIINAKEKGEYLKSKLQALRNISIVKDIRGKGLMAGVELSIPCRPIVMKMLNEGYLINCTAEKTLRFLPPLIITETELDGMIETLEGILVAEIQKK